MKVFIKRRPLHDYWFDIYNVIDGKMVGYILRDGSGCHIEQWANHDLGGGTYADARYACAAVAKHVTISKDDLQLLRKNW